MRLRAGSVGLQRVAFAHKGGESVCERDVALELKRVCAADPLRDDGLVVDCGSGRIEHFRGALPGEIADSHSVLRLCEHDPRNRREDWLRERDGRRVTECPPWFERIRRIVSLQVVEHAPSVGHLDVRQEG